MGAERAVFVYGAGGHARVVIDTIESSNCGCAVSFVVDDDVRLHGRQLLGHPIRPRDAIRDEPGFIAIGANPARLKTASRFRGRLIVVVHRRSYIARGVPVGEGSVFVAGSIVNVGAVIGENVIVNTGATVGHDCVIGDGVHIAPGCHLCGHVQVGEGSFLGVGTLVTPGVSIGKNVFIHAGSRITRDIPDGETVQAWRQAYDPS
jgi:sugar O-acyltransferase (sialic acid O-acetyltransferase NeuD family)